MITYKIRNNSALAVMKKINSYYNSYYHSYLTESAKLRDLRSKNVLRRGNMAVVNVDVRNKITEAIINLKTVKHTKPKAEKIYSYLKKSDDELELVVPQSYLEKLVKDKY